MSILIVDLRAKGMTRGPKEHRMGQPASPVDALTFEDVRLPESAILGNEGRGFHDMMNTLDSGHFGTAALAVRIPQTGLEAAFKNAQLRKQFKKQFVEFQSVQWPLADQAKDIDAARLPVLSAAVKIDNGQRATKLCSIAKCSAGDMAVARTSDAVQDFGGSGCIRGFKVERLYGDAKVCRIYEGTNQIRRKIIAGELVNTERYLDLPC